MELAKIQREDTKKAFEGKEILKVWNATHVMRWHVNPKMNHTRDMISGHSQRLVLLALKLHPQLSREAIIFGLTHDIGESEVGDFAYPLKLAQPKLADVLATMEANAAEALGFPFPELVEFEAKLIKLCDWLDAYLWVNLHNKICHCIIV